jgi:hypothetical protein
MSVRASKKRSSVLQYAGGTPKPPKKAKKAPADDLPDILAPTKLDLFKSTSHRRSRFIDASLDQLRSDTTKAQERERREAAALRMKGGSGRARGSSLNAHACDLIFNAADNPKKTKSAAKASSSCIDLTADTAPAARIARSLTDYDSGLVSGSDDDDDFVDSRPPSSQKRDVAESDDDDADGGTSEEALPSLSPVRKQTAVKLKKVTIPVGDRRFAPPDHPRPVTSRKTNSMRARGDPPPVPSHPARPVLNRFAVKGDTSAKTISPHAPLKVTQQAPRNARAPSKPGATRIEKLPGVCAKSDGTTPPLRKAAGKPAKAGKGTLTKEVMSKSPRKSPPSSLLYDTDTPLAARKTSQRVQPHQPPRQRLETPRKIDMSKDVRLRALTDEQTKSYRAATYQIAKGKVVAEIAEANIVLRGVDIVRLRGRRWLNDEVINSFCALINSRSRKHFAGKPRPTFPPLKELNGISSRHKTDVSGTDVSSDDSDGECKIVETAAAMEKQRQMDRNGSPVVRPGRPRAYVFNSFFYTRMSQNGYDYNGVRRWPTRAGVDIASLDLVMMPVNLSNFHWVLAAVDLRHREFVYFDSMYGPDSTNVLSMLRRWLADEIKDKHGDELVQAMDIDSWRFIDRPCYLPRQTDDGSCGVFTLYIADYLELGRTPDFVQEDMPLMRQHAVLFLTNKALPEK